MVLDVRGPPAPVVLDVRPPVEVGRTGDEPGRSRVVGEAPPDRVRHREHPPPARPQHPGHLREDRGRVGHERDRAVRRAREVERPAGEGQARRRRPATTGHPKTGPGVQARGPGQLPGGDVHPHDPCALRPPATGRTGRRRSPPRARVGPPRARAGPPPPRPAPPGTRRTGRRPGTPRARPGRRRRRRPSAAARRARESLGAPEAAGASTRFDRSVVTSVSWPVRYGPARPRTEQAARSRQSSARVHPRAQRRTRETDPRRSRTTNTAPERTTP